MPRNASEITSPAQVRYSRGVTEPLLELRAVEKTFGQTRALSGVSFDVRAGEVHVLAGGNGAGKSTLIKILSGAITDFAGELRVEGRAVHFREPSAAARAGVATIHQELSLVPSLSVLDNLFLGERRPLFSRWTARPRRDEARRMLARVGLELDPERRVEDLGLAERQLVEIARALHHTARVLILDEPTSALAEPEAERLFERMRELRDGGRGVVFISHRLDEIFRLADRITVLRDGRVVHTGPASELDERTLVEHMVGKTVELADDDAERGTGEPLLSVSGLCVPGARGGRPLLDDVSLELAAGEIVGVAGLQDSGASELLHALAGAVPSVRQARLAGKSYQPRSPAQAVATGVTLLPRDRNASVFPARSIVENATLGSLGRVSRAGVISLRRERALAAEVTGRMGLVAPSLDAPAGSLSGGNQQKVALARCLLTQPKLILLDDPTRGVDVAAKADVHRLVREAAQSGAGVLFVSTDFDELLALSDRVLVLFRGRRRALCPKRELSRERLLALSMGSS